MSRMILAIFLAPLLAIGASPDDYALVIPIETPGESAAWQVVLDGVNQVSVDPDSRDLAVFNADGQPVPIKVYPAEFVDQKNQPSAPELQPGKPPGAGQAQRLSVPVLPVPNPSRGDRSEDLQLVVNRDASGRLRRLEANSSSGSAQEEQEAREWWIDLQGLDGGIEFLELDWDEPRQDVVARFEVCKSRDLQDWNNCDPDAVAVRLEKDGARIVQRSIKVGSLQRYLRLRRLDEGPALAGLRAEATAINRKRLLTSAHWIEATPVERIGDLTANNTRHLYEIGGWSPTISVRASSLSIKLADENTVAQLDVFTLPAGNSRKPNWSHRASVDAFNLQQGDETIDNGETLLSFGTRVPRVRSIRIDSVTPLSNHPYVLAGYRPERLLFLAEGRGPFVLAMGNATEKYPDYPVEAALRSLRSRLGQDWQPPMASLDEDRALYREEQASLATGGAQWKRWLLWTVLFGAAAVVGGLSLSLLRTSQRSAKDRQQPPEE